MIHEEGSSSVSSSPLQMFSMMSQLSPNLALPYFQEMKSEERGLCLIHLLIACANHVSAGNIEQANICLEYISHLASPEGDTMQRIAAHFSEALADRVLKSWPGLHKALNSTKISPIGDELLAKKLFFEICPFLRLSYVITNQTILEAMEGEKVIHIIDLNCFEPAQWISLLHALNSRHEGPPHLRITGVHEQKEVLDQMAHRLNGEAEKLDIPFQFYPVVSTLENLDVEKIRVKTGEAVAISSVLQFHSLLALDENMMQRNLSKTPNGLHLERVLQMNRQTLADFLERDGVQNYGLSPDSASSSPISSTLASKTANLLNSLWGLSPKLMVVTEQESNHNGSTLMERTMEALTFYAALFDCLESTIPRASEDRLKIEKILFGEEIKNIVACEGIDRKKRHERLEKWIPRLELAGFSKVSLSYNVMVQAWSLLQSYNYDGYKVKEENGCLFMCWQDQPLFSCSAWRFRR